MNIESANIRAHKAVIEDIIGLTLKSIPRTTGNITYELYDADGKFIKDTRQLQSMLFFISKYFNYSYTLLEESIFVERLRLIKENVNILKSAEHESKVRNTNEKFKHKAKFTGDKPSKPYKAKCPHCAHHKCIIKNKDKDGLFIQYECKNCCKSHIRDIENNIIKADRKNAKKIILKNAINLNVIDIILQDNNIRH